MDIPESLHLLQPLIDCQAGDHQEQQSGGSPHPLDQGSDLVHLGHDLDLFLLHVRLWFAQEQLVILLHGEGATVNEEDDQDGGDNSPHS